ncbi:MAG: lysophospholipid acyltransferase family protein [Pseudobdellovibrionaceae bacterium]
MSAVPLGNNSTDRKIEKQMLFIRQILFNIAFYGWTTISCFLMLPFLIMPHKIYVVAVTAYFKSVHLLEKYILGLDYVVIGAENLPKDGKTFLVAAKHQSAYETMKLYLLFNDPAIILKRELAWIPLWGWIALKSGAIAINRKSREIAVASLTEGAKRIKKTGRPIVIFPQGTRVPVNSSPEQYRYRPGIVKMAKAAHLDIVPMAMNTGLFWEKKAFFKKPGIATFSILPPLSHQMSTEELMKTMTKQIEEESNRLRDLALRKES